MNSLIFRTTTRLMLPILILFSFFLVLRGHNLPGGGFIGGLVAAAAVLLQLVSQGPKKTRQIFSWNSKHLFAFGLSLAVLAGVPGLFTKGSFLAGVWVSVPLYKSEIIKLGTPLLFDLGVYLVVFGVAVEFVLEIAEEEQWKVF